MHLGTLTADATGQLDILGHDGDTLSVNGAQVGVFKETDEVGLGRLLESHDGRALETQVRLEVLGNLTDETLEGELADQQLRALLVATDFTQSHSTGAVTMRLLDTTGSRGGFASSLGGELLSGRFASGRLASGLLSTGHRAFLSRSEEGMREREKNAPAFPNGPLGGGAFLPAKHPAQRDAIPFMTFTGFSTTPHYTHYMTTTLAQMV